MRKLTPSQTAPSTTRRAFMSLAAGAGLTVYGASVLSPFSPAAFAQAAAEIPVADLMKPGPLPELVYGNADAKVTIIEYASMTCSHCQNFHENIFPALKAKYIDTGKARLIFREFPLNNLAAGASMLARCAGPGKELKMVDLLFKTQDKWAFARSNPLPGLFAIAKQAGFTQARFDECLKDQKLLNNLSANRERASTAFGVNSTPHFFVNGKRLSQGTMAEFEKVIEPMLKG